MPGVRGQISIVALSAALLVLVAAGAGHRWLTGRIDASLTQTLVLAQPLATLPLALGEWDGRDVPLDEEVQRIAGDDEMVNRHYVHRATGRGVALYVGYMGRPRSRMGHRPDVCYPAHGFQEVSRRPMSVTMADGTEVPCLLFEFRSPRAGGPRDFVLATYIINGQYSNDTSAANAYNARGIGLSGRGATYVARIQATLRASGDDGRDVTALRDLFGIVVPAVVERMPVAAADAPKQTAGGPDGQPSAAGADVQAWAAWPSA